MLLFKAKRNGEIAGSLESGKSQVLGLIGLERNEITTLFWTSFGLNILAPAKFSLIYDLVLAN